MALSNRVATERGRFSCGYGCPFPFTARCNHPHYTLDLLVSIQMLYFVADPDNIVVHLRALDMAAQVQNAFFTRMQSA